MKRKENEYLEFMKKYFGKKESWLILLLVGILLVVIAIPLPESDDSTKEEETSLQSTDASVDEAYVSRLERRLEDALTKVQGVGKVSVMITLSASSEKIVEKDREISSESSESGEADSSKGAVHRKILYIRESDEVPYVTKELSPDIEGVLVIADGGDNAVVIENITEAVQALFPVDTHKIKVMKRS